jgi:hypothetical protein
MITGIDDHNPPETMITISWIERSRSNGIGDHNRPERAANICRAVRLPIAMAPTASGKRHDPIEIRWITHL